MKFLRWNKLRRDRGADQEPGRLLGIRRVALRIALFVGMVSFVTLADAGTPASAAGAFAVPPLASITFTLPPTVLTPNTENFNCLARTDYYVGVSGDTAPVRVVCYNAPQPSAAPPPPPPPYEPADHLEFTATYYESTGRIRTNIISCAWIPPTALRITMEAWLSKTQGQPATNGSVTVRENSGPLAEEDLCAYGTETTSPLTLTPLPLTHNADIDALGVVNPDECTSWEELGTDPAKGGLRDPFNPYDIFDVNGAGGQPDGIVDLLYDILGVIQHYSPSVGGALYDAQYDRGGQLGPYSWNKNKPDGVIDLLNDILGAITQYLHDCTDVPN